MATIAHGIGFGTTLANTANQPSYPVTLTPPADSLLVVFVGTSGNMTDVADTIQSNVTDLNFVKVPGGLVTMSDDLRRAQMYVATKLAAAVSTTITYTSSIAYTSGYIEVFALTGISRLGVDAVRQIAPAGTSAFNTAFNFTFPAPALTTNPCAIGFNATQGSGNPTLAGAGWLTVAGALASTNSPASRYISYWHDGGFVGPSETAVSYGSPRCGIMIELDASAPPAAGPVANLTVTEAPDTVSADGTLTWPERFAGMSKTEGADTIASAGSVSIGASLLKVDSDDTLVAHAGFPPIAAGLTVTEGGDALAADLGVLAKANLSKTEAGDTLSSGVSAIASASVNKLEDPDTLASVVKIAVVANSSVTEQGDTLYAEGTPIVPGIIASLSVTESADILATSSNAIVGVSLGKTEAADTLASASKAIIGVDLSADEIGDGYYVSALVTVSASLSVVEEGDGLVSSLSVVGVIAADLNKTESGDTVSASTEAAPEIKANLSVIEGADSSASDVDALVKANLTKTEIADGLYAVAAATVKANLSKSDADVLTAAASNIVTANLGKTEGADVLGAVCTTSISCYMDVTEEDDTLAGSAGTPSTTDRTILLEFGPDSMVNAGTFSMRSAAARTYMTVKGTGAVVEGDFTLASTEQPYALTALVDLAGPSVITRTNGVQVDMDVSPLGGNFGVQKIYLGAGMGNRDPARGRLYQLIIRGAFSSAAQVADIENYTAMKTGADLPAVTTVEVMPGVIKRLNRRPRWYHLSPPPWVMMILVTICLSGLLAGCAVAVRDEEFALRMEDITKYLFMPPFV